MDWNWPQVGDHRGPHGRGWKIHVNTRTAMAIPLTWVSSTPLWSRRRQLPIPPFPVRLFRVLSARARNIKASSRTTARSCFLPAPSILAPWTWAFPSGHLPSRFLTPSRRPADSSALSEKAGYSKTQDSNGTMNYRFKFFVPIERGHAGKKRSRQTAFL